MSENVKCKAGAALPASDRYAATQKQDLYERDYSSYLHAPCHDCKHRHTALDGPKSICRQCVHYAA